MKLYLKVLLFWGFYLLSFTSLSQIPYLKQYTVSDGLLTNEIYQVFQDSQGYIWLATGTGVCKFNGKHFISVDKPKEFRNSSIHEIKEDGNKQLWFVSLTGNLFYRKSSKVLPFVYNAAIQDKQYTNKGHIRNSFTPLSDSSVVISLKEKGAIIVRGNGVVDFKYPNQTSEVILDFSKKTPFFSFESGRSGLKPNVKVLDSKCAPLVFDLKISPTHLYAAKLRNGCKVFSLDRIVYVVGKGGLKTYEMTDAVTGIFEDKDSRIWISVNGHGVHCYSNENFSSSLLFKILEKETVTSVLEDREGSFWFSTINSGIFFTPSLAFANYTTTDGLLSDKISKVMCKEGEVWVGYADGFVSKVDRDGKVINFVNSRNNTAYVKGFGYSSSDKSVWVCADILYRIRNGKVDYYERELVKGDKNPNYALLPRSVVKSRDGGFWVASNRGFKKILNGKVVFDSHQTGDFTGIVYSLSETKNGSLWVASNSLYLYSRGVLRKVGVSNSLLNSSIIKCAINTYDHRLWMATKGYGVLILNRNKLIQINTSKGLQSNNITSLDISGNQVWVTSNSGVDCIVIKSADPLTYTIKHYNTSHGLLNNDVRDVCVSGRYAYFATVSGLSCLNIAKGAGNSVPPPVVISSVKVNEKERRFDQPLNLGYEENFIDISFDGLTYKREGDIRYRYMLEGLSDKWFYTSEGTIRLYKLTPGSYKLIIAAENNDRIWSKTPAVVIFSIANPFWATYWFYSICLLLFVLAVFAFFYTRLQIVKKINMYERKGNLWKNQSLSLQMNPHFIFNTLNSIQLYILKCDVDSSLHYLSRFSNLMRKTLENSNRINITIKEELDALEIYLELEALRCEGKFAYSIECDSNISQTESYIPTLLIQPYVENAIWHGIMPKTGNGKIQIKIQNAGVYIKCSIIDDGVGRVKSQEIQRMSLTRKHKSFATNITGRRMDLLKALYSKEFSFECIDKYDNDGNSLGTEVVLIIPRDFISAKHVNQFAE